MKKLWDKLPSIQREFIRLILILSSSIWFLYDTELFPLLKMGIGISIVIMGITHILRRTLIPYVHLEELYKKILNSQNAIACSIIFSSMIYLITILTQIVATMIKI